MGVIEVGHLSASEGSQPCLEPELTETKQQVSLSSSFPSDNPKHHFTLNGDLLSRQQWVSPRENGESAADDSQVRRQRALTSEGSYRHRE